MSDNKQFVETTSINDAGKVTVTTLEYREPAGEFVTGMSVEPVVAQTPAEPKNGVVVDCAKLNVREEPSVNADVICEIAKNTKVLVEEDASTDDFYKVYLSTGVEGFCMRKYIAIR